jgi:hypothetical protein
MAPERIYEPRKNPDVGPYFKVPKGLIQNGIAARIGPSAVTVYVALCEHANYANGNVFSTSDRALAAETGVAERTIREVRTRLQSEMLISFTRSLGQSYTYTVIPVKPAARIPVKEKLRQPRKRRGLHATERSADRAGKASHAEQNSALPATARSATPPTANLATPTPAKLATPSRKSCW